jgi:hypothetical protein
MLAQGNSGQPNKLRGIWSNVQLKERGLGGYSKIIGRGEGAVSTL